METRRLVLVLTGVAVATILVIGILVVATMGGGDDDDTASNGDSNGEGTPLPERVEGELRLFGPDPVSLDPACASDAGSAEYIVEIYSGLLSFDRDLNVVNDIAESYDVSPDQTVYTFHLRRNVLFHDQSRRVTAGDFKFSIERALNPDTLSTVAEVYLDDIVGALEYANGEVEEITGVQAINDDTLEITIKEPSAHFIEKLTYPTAYVVDQREVGDSSCFEGADWTRNPNGTGPFKMVEWDLGQRIVLEPNAEFYLEPKPAVSQVTFFLSGGSPLVMYENDELDITGVGANDIERIRDANEPLNAEFHEAESLDVFYIGFNSEQAPFNDPKVRQALTMALDRELLANEILQELVIPADGVLPPGMPGYNDALEGYEYDPEAAADLLDEAGGPELFDDVSLKVSGAGGSPSDYLEAIVALWEQNLGISIAIEQEDFGLFLRDLDEGNFQMFSLGWIADYPDPQNFLDIKFHSESAKNQTGYSNPEVDALLEQARTETDEDARLAIYQEAEQIIVTEAAWLTLYHGKASYLVKPYVVDYEVPPFVIPNLRYVSLTQ